MADSEMVGPGFIIIQVMRPVGRRHGGGPSCLKSLPILWSDLVRVHPGRPAALPTCHVTAGGYGPGPGCRGRDVAVLARRRRRGPDRWCHVIVRLPRPGHSKPLLGRIHPYVRSCSANGRPKKSQSGQMVVHANLARWFKLSTAFVRGNPPRPMPRRRRGGRESPAGRRAGGAGSTRTSRETVPDPVRSRAPLPPCDSESPGASGDTRTPPGTQNLHPPPTASPAHPQARPAGARPGPAAAPSPSRGSATGRGSRGGRRGCRRGRRRCRGT